MPVGRESLRRPGRRRRLRRLVVAERLAAVPGQRVLVIDRRDHIAGNAYDYHDEHGVLVHHYGPHIFHTNSEKVVDYLSRFTDGARTSTACWRDVDGQLLPMPINRTRSTRSTGSTCDRRGGRGVPRRRAPSRVEHIRNSEDVVVAKVGRELYEKFFRGYTRKQWERDPSRAARVGVRAHPDPHQQRRPLLHRLASRRCRPTATRRCSSGCSTTRTSRSATGVDFDDVRDEVDYDHLVCTGPDRRVLRPPLRRAALPLAASSSCATSRRPDGGLLLPVAVGQRARPRTCLHARHRVPAPDRPGARRLDAARSSTRAPRATRTTRSRRDDTRALYKRYEALAARERRRHVRRPPGPLPVPEHGPGRRPGAGRVHGDVRSLGRPCLSRSSAP